MTSIITQIWTGAIKTWDEAEAAIDADAKTIGAAIEDGAQAALAAIVPKIKQGASDAIGNFDTALATAAPGIATSAEALLDSALTKYTGGLAVGLIPVVNKGVDDIEAAAVAAVHAWALSAKASLAKAPVTQTTA